MRVAARPSALAAIVLASLALGLASCGRYGPPVRKPAPVSEAAEQPTSQPAAPEPDEPQEPRG
jgi:predicted small lipoprotein YifL